MTRTRSRHLSTTTAPTSVLAIHTATLPPLGADTWVHLQILANLDRARFDLHVACTTGPPGHRTPTYAELSRIDGVHVVPVDFGPELYLLRGLAKAKAAARTLLAVRSVPRLAWYVRRHGIGLIHTSDRPRDAAAAVVLGRLTRVPTIVHVHVAYGDWMGRLLRWALAHADHLVAVSDFVGSTLTAAGIPADRVHVVHNAIDPSRWTGASPPAATRTATRAALGLPPGAPTVISVSRLFAAKGTEQLIRAMAVVRRTIPDARLLVAGADPAAGEPYLGRLRTVVAELGLADAVDFLGRRSDVPDLMAAADVYAMPSYEEPFGLVFIEAMATGLPVVALDNGGTVEVVTHGETGLLAPPGDVDALAGHITALLADPARRVRLGDRGRARVAALFTTPAQAVAVAELYDRVLGQPLPAA